MNKIKVGIIGASGYGGGELLRRLLVHPHVEIVGIDSRQYLGKSLAECWPQLVGFAEHLRFEDSDTVIDKCDVLFSAAPHATATSTVKSAIDKGKKVLDLSADFRLTPELFEQWYGTVHPHPELCSEAVYGLCEFHRDEIKETSLVAVPGCNSTTANFAVGPLAAHNLLGDNVVIHCITGISGAGRSAKVNNLYSEVNENYVPYSLAGTHRHTQEIEDLIGRVEAIASKNISAGKDTGVSQVLSKLKTHSNFEAGEFEAGKVSFNPYRVPMTRCEMASVYVRPEHKMGTEGVLELLHSFYQNEPLIIVQDALPQSKAVAGTDRVIISAKVDERTGHIVVLSTLDNMGKGAAGQAVQNFNIMHNFDEHLGLTLQAVWP